MFFFMYEAIKYGHSDPILILSKAFTFGLLYALCVKESNTLDEKKQPATTST